MCKNSIDERKNEIEEIKRIAKPISDYLKRNGDPYQSIVITQTDCRLLQDVCGVAFDILD